MKCLTIYYDKFCPYCTKFAKLVQNLDWLKLIKIKQLRIEIDNTLFGKIDLELTKQKMASFDSKWYYGYNSLYIVFIRLLLFWLFIPFLYILKLAKIGQLMYFELVVKRKIIPFHWDAVNFKL